MSSGCGNSDRNLFSNAGSTSGGSSSAGAASGGLSSGGFSIDTGGSSASGGAAGGGTSSTGGARTTGGTAASGGKSNAGADAGGADAGGDGSAGDGDPGGAVSTGGSPVTGGAANTGGVSGGGVSNQGGAASGGASSTGGIANSGGASGGTNTGGLANTGGSNTGGSATGGTNNSGGTVSTGGTGGVGGHGPSLQSGSRTVASFKGVHCESISFKTAFDAPAANILVQATAIHPGATQTHGALAVWVQSIDEAGFDVCLTEDAGLNASHRESRIDWVAALAQSTPSLGGAAGRLALGPVSGRSCQVVTFPTVLSDTPQLQVTANRQGAAEAAGDPISVWVEDVSGLSFRVCAEELAGSDGKLDGTNVDWFAYPGSVSSAGFSAGERNLAAFSGVECVDIATGCANCQNVQLSVNHRRRTEGAAAAHAATLVWGEDLTARGVLTACVTNTSGYLFSHDGHLSIDWLLRQTND